jgi:hypothetical protein
LDNKPDDTSDSSPKQGCVSGIRSKYYASKDRLKYLECD